MRRSTAAALLAGTLLLTPGAFAGVVYTWIDAGGHVQYSDHPPKNFTGPVKRMEIDDPQPPPAAPRAPLPAPKAEAKAVPATPAKASDIGTKRRADRERLQHDLDVAREKLAAARQALADHQTPETDERQIVQRPGAAPKGKGMPGIVDPSTRLNCREIDKGGKKATMCPVSMPSEAYFDRIAGLEQAVKDAEEEVAAAERAYRRGVD